MFAVLTDDEINLFPTIDKAVAHADNWHFFNKTTTARLFRPDVINGKSCLVEVIHHEDEHRYRGAISAMASELLEAEWARS